MGDINKLPHHLYAYPDMDLIENPIAKTSTEMVCSSRQVFRAGISAITILTRLCRIIVKIKTNIKTTHTHAAAAIRDASE